MVGMLKWWFIFFCSVATVAAMASYGLISRLWELDEYKACFITITAYFSMSCLVGRLTWRAAKNGERNYSYDGVVQYSPDLMTQLGLIGTVIGFVMMMAAFSVSSDPATLQKSSTLMIEAAKVALFNTLAGLCCSVLMKAQVLNLGMVHDE